MAITITLEILQKICPSTHKDILTKRISILQMCLDLAEAVTPLRASALLAQYAYESAWFRAWIEEPSDVSGPNFEKYEPGTKVGKILGNTKKGDGALFKGRGLVEITGRYNYQKAGEAIGVDLVNNPELAADPVNASKVAAWYWTSRNLNKYADLEDFEEITRKINGGLNGQSFRLAAYSRAKAALGG